jgi:hypothetical protein
MKKIITLFTFLLASSFGVYAQTNNLNEYNLKVYFDYGKGVVDNDPGTWGESRYHIRAGNYESSSSPTHLLNTNVGADNGVRNYGSTGPATYYGYDNNPNVEYSWTGPQVYYPILPNGSNSLTTTQSNTTGKFNVSVMSYAWDSGLSYIYQGEPNGNMGFLNKTVSFTLNKFPNNELTDSGEIDNAADGIYRFGAYEGYGTDSYYRIKYCFRPKHGKKNDPLDFGTLVSGAAAISQINSNRSSPYSTYYNSTDFGYSNDWNGSGFYSGNDITYKFTITKQQIVKWTISKTIGNDRGNFLGSMLMDANNLAVYRGFQTAAIQDHSIGLCAGTYTLVLEGVGSSITPSASSFHDFNISITATDYSPNPGSIANSTNDFSLCPNEAIPAINNASSASGTVGTPTYQWWKQLRVNGVLQGWNHYTAAGTGTSATNLGTMENADFCWIMRFATDCGGGVWSNQMGFTGHNVTLNAGTITGSKTVPFPHEQGNAIGNISSASASPSQVILWQKSTNPDSESSWGNADGVNSSQSYTLPASIPQTTSFRRKISNACDGVAGYNGVAYSNSETISIINPNGIISGRVRSSSGAGVSGVTITAVRTSSPPPGGIPNKIYTTTTTSIGNYSFANNIPPEALYYGSTASGSNAAATFLVTPSKGVGAEAHVFKLENSNPRQEDADAILTQISPNATDIVFIDETVFAVTGTITQECADCDGKTAGDPAVFYLPDVSFEVTDPLPAEGDPYPPSIKNNK